MSVFLKNITFHGILTDALFEEDNEELIMAAQCLSEGIKTGTVKPLQTIVFNTDQVEDAFRYMAQGKHIGKVLIKVILAVVYLLNEKLSLAVHKCIAVITLTWTQLFKHNDNDR